MNQATEADEELINLIARCALRDRKALQLLYERTAGYLNAIAFRIVRSEESSNDVLQEAFLQIWHNAQRYRPASAKPMTWLSSIVRYRALDRLDHERYHQRHLRNDEDSELDQIASLDDSPEQQVLANQQQKLLQDCLNHLNDKIATCIRLAYVRGCSREEIATTLETNVNTVKSWLHRGADMLRQCLQRKLAT